MLKQKEFHRHLTTLVTSTWGASINDARQFSMIFRCKLLLNQEVFWCTFDSGAFIEQSVLIICFHGNEVTFMFGGLSTEHVIFKTLCLGLSGTSGSP